VADRFAIDDELPGEVPGAAAELDSPVFSPRPADFTVTAIRGVPRENETDTPPRSAVDTTYRTASRDVRRGRIEPTLDEVAAGDAHGITAELPVEEDWEPQTPIQADAPTLSMSNTPQPKRTDRRKIIALRLAAGAQRFAGVQLLQTLEAETLQYGKYDVFHRLHTDGSNIFSVASMVEPGTFNLETMASLTYPGVTLFMQLPGPVPGIEALNELAACGKRLQERLGGTLQDERGVPLTVHRIERLRQEVREFESVPGRDMGRDPTHRGVSSPAP
jgi:cell division protein ZipA